MYSASESTELWRYKNLSIIIIINQSINQSVFISGKMPIETNNKQTV